jgi:hypothetical protein
MQSGFRSVQSTPQGVQNVTRGAGWAAQAGMTSAVLYRPDQFFVLTLWFEPIVQSCGSEKMKDDAAYC